MNCTICGQQIDPRFESCSCVEPNQDPKPTIIKRVVDALVAAGHDALATELYDFMKRFKKVTGLFITQNAQGHTLAKQYIHTVQSRCSHQTWALCLPMDKHQLCCWLCGHTVCDEHAYTYVRNVLKRANGYGVTGRAGLGSANEERLMKEGKWRPKGKPDDPREYDVQSVRVQQSAAGPVD